MGKILNMAVSVSAGLLLWTAAAHAQAQGCCKVGSGCASPVSDAQCSSMNGTFHEGAVCIVADGTCRVPHDDDQAAKQTPIPDPAPQPAEPEKEDQYRGTQMVTFVAVEGRTVLNRDYVGNIQTISLIAVDGTRRPASEDEISVTDRGDRIDVQVPDGSPIRGFAVKGDQGEIVAETSPPERKIVTFVAVDDTGGPDDSGPTFDEPDPESVLSGPGKEGTGRTIDTPSPEELEKRTADAREKARRSAVDVSGDSYLEKEVRRTLHPDPEVRRLQEKFIVFVRLSRTILLLGDRATAEDRSRKRVIEQDLKAGLEDLSQNNARHYHFLLYWVSDLSTQITHDIKRLLHRTSEPMRRHFNTPSAKIKTRVGPADEPRFNEPDEVETESPEDEEGADAPKFDEPAPDTIEADKARPAADDRPSVAFVSRLWLDRQVAHTLDPDPRVRTLQLAYFEAKRRLMSDKVLGNFDEDKARAVAQDFDTRIAALRAGDPELAEYFTNWRAKLDYFMEIGLMLAQYGRPAQRLENEALIAGLPSRIKPKTPDKKTETAAAEEPAESAQPDTNVTIPKEDRLDALLDDFVGVPTPGRRGRPPLDGAEELGIDLNDKGAMDRALAAAEENLKKKQAAEVDVVTIPPGDRIDALLEDFVGGAKPGPEQGALRQAEFMFLDGPIIPDLPDPLSPPETGTDWGAFNADPPYWLEEGGLPVDPMQMYPSLPGYTTPGVTKEQVKEAWKQNPLSFWPTDGMVDLRAQNLNESFTVPPGFLDLNVGPDAHRLTVNDKPADIIAVRQGEIAAKGEDIPLGDPNSDVALTNQDGYTIIDEMPSWGFEATTQPYVELGAWYPVTVQLVGVEPNELIPISFQPRAGQFIEPLTVTIIGQQAASPLPVAQFMTTVEGLQKFTATATRNTIPAIPPDPDNPFDIGLSGLPIFSDGFESGDTSSWSNTIP